jgi:hypothetical protein
MPDADRPEHLSPSRRPDFAHFFRPTSASSSLFIGAGEN